MICFISPTAEKGIFIDDYEQHNHSINLGNVISINRFDEFISGLNDYIYCIRFKFLDGCEFCQKYLNVEHRDNDYENSGGGSLPNPPHNPPTEN